MQIFLFQTVLFLCRIYIRTLISHSHVKQEGLTSFLKDMSNFSFTYNLLKAQPVTELRLVDCTQYCHLGLLADVPRAACSQMKMWRIRGHTCSVVRRTKWSVFNGKIY